MAGLANNIDFLIKIVRHRGFTTEIANTGFFNRYMTEILASLSHPDVSGYGEHTSFGIASFLEAQKQAVGSGLWSGAEVTSESVGAGLSDWRNQRSRSHSMTVTHPAAASSTAVSTVTSAEGTEVLISAAAAACKVEHRCRLKSKSLVAESKEEHATFSVWDNVIEINGRMVSGTTSIHTNKVTQIKLIDVWLNGSVADETTHFQFTIPAPNFSVDGAASSNTVATSPMPGKIIQVVAKDGKDVKKGDPIAILEAMKMEHVVHAPCDG